jgi:hypothetical protein
VAGKRKGAKTSTTGEKRVTRTTKKTPAEVAVAAEAATTTAPAVTEVAERGMSDVDQMLVGLGAQAEGDAGAHETEDAGQPDVVLPEIDPLATFWTELDLFCRDCGITHYVSFCTLLNAEESPHLVERAKANQMNYKRCPLCKKIEYVQHPWTFFDPQRKLVVQIRPEWEWHAGGGEEWYDARLEDLFDKWSEHDVKLDVTFGPEQFIERYLRDEEVVSRKGVR